MHYKKLYKRTATGAVQVWWQELEGGRYRTHSGQVDGQIVTSEWTQAKPKNVGRSNETSAEDQATSEVESNYTRKRKDGYSDSVSAAKDSNRFSPMLAKDFDDYKDKLDLSKAGGLWCQPKLDGIRCIANAQGLWSRKGDRIVSCPHIEGVLMPFFAAMPDLMLDGELYNHNLKDNFNEITSLVKKLKPTDEHFAKTAEIVQYHVYDSPSPDDYAERVGRIIDLIEDVGLPLVHVPTKWVQGVELLDRWYEEWLDAGYEGQMIRLPGPYETKRSKLLLKRKEFVDSEFVVLDILEGVGNASGGAKVAWLQLDTDPTKKFKADVVGTKAERVQILTNRHKLIGKMATVKYFKQRTPAGIPRFGKIKLIHEAEKW
jgi:DNA ligase-1